MPIDLLPLLNDKTVKPKEITENLSFLLLEKKITISELLKFAENQKDPIKATCIESLEFATKKDPNLSTIDCLHFVSNSLSTKAPRIKWESARVIGNIAHLYPNDLEIAINNLLINTEHPGTVVRWSAAFALGEILKLNNNNSKLLIPAMEAICEREEKNSIKKIYLSAMKKVK